MLVRQPAVHPHGLCTGDSKSPCTSCNELQQTATSRVAASCYALRTPTASTSEATGREVPHLQVNCHGPGRNRTCDLGIKSPARRAATSGARLKRAATGANRRCNELQRNAPEGEKPVRPRYARA